VSHSKVIQQLLGLTLEGKSLIMNVGPVPSVNAFYCPYSFYFMTR